MMKEDSLRFGIRMECLLLTDELSFHVCLGCIYSRTLCPQGTKRCLSGPGERGRQRIKTSFPYLCFFFRLQEKPTSSTYEVTSAKA